MRHSVLVVQFRTDMSLAHEQTCFDSDLSPYVDDIVYVDAINGELPVDITQYRAVILGGSGEFHLSRGDGVGSWRERTYDFIHSVIDHDIPLFGVCFGYQMLCLAYGAEISDDVSMRETGTFRILVSPQSSFDPLFAGLPDTFLGQFGHKDTVTHAPSDIFDILAKTERTPLTAVRLRGKKVWGVLFHPELNQERMRERLELFPSYAGGKSIEEMVAKFQDTPHAAQMLVHFMRIVTS